MHLRLCNKINTMSAINAAETDYPSGTPEMNPSF